MEVAGGPVDLAPASALCSLCLHPQAKTRAPHNPRGVALNHGPTSTLVVLGKFQGKCGRKETNLDVSGAHPDQGPWNGF